MGVVGALGGVILLVSIIVWMICVVFSGQMGASAPPWVVVVALVGVILLVSVVSCMILIDFQT